MLLTGTTTDNFDPLTDQHATPDDGLHMFGSIKNTGSNDLLFRVVVTDVYGQTDTIDTTIKFNAGNRKGFFSLLSAVGANTQPPYTDIFFFFVKSGTAGQPTSYEFHSTQW